MHKILPVNGIIFIHLNKTCFNSFLVLHGKTTAVYSPYILQSDWRGANYEKGLWGEMGPPFIQLLQVKSATLLFCSVSIRHFLSPLLLPNKLGFFVSVFNCLFCFFYLLYETLKEQKAEEKRSKVDRHPREVGREKCFIIKRRDNFSMHCIPAHSQSVERMWGLQTARTHCCSLNWIAEGSSLQLTGMNPADIHDGSNADQNLRSWKPRF